MTRTTVLSDTYPRRQLPAYFVGLESLPTWNSRAACIGAEPRLFFPKGKNQDEQASQAREICATCPVTAECLKHAESMPEPFGVWGGTTPQERGWDTYGRRNRSTRGAAPPTP
ncbi:WhiB family transcriptional regulator [Streptomyces sp. TRM72054]|uniref:WhiB family transcriptional regulator n=1 Tax=Streptomyces sp. TRM72054 TaxID=2870562 RepID=UPI001C8C8C20|nr:WhiB family transcriptional regulator [Streptomyces sp. TRM72054]MBX9398988.1 WhiB family transcriptional regulator [Streptomyces sp. TRM72054]